MEKTPHPRRFMMAKTDSMGVSAGNDIASQGLSVFARCIWEGQWVMFLECLEDRWPMMTMQPTRPPITASVKQMEMK